MYIQLSITVSFLAIISQLKHRREADRNAESYSIPFSLLNP